MALQLEEEFKEYAEKAKSLPPRTTDADKLILYGLYKQATVGSVNTNRPGFFSPTERAKWDAWKAVDAKTNNTRMRKERERDPKIPMAMNDFEGFLTSDFGFKPYGKSALIIEPRPSYSSTSSLSPPMLFSWWWAPPDDPLEGAAASTSGP